MSGAHKARVKVKNLIAIIIVTLLFKGMATGYTQVTSNITEYCYQLDTVEQ